jgi:peptide/nickel transport system permease protein
MLIAPLRRVAEALAVLMVVSLGVFALSDAAPGTFLSEMRANPRISAATLATLEERFDISAPLYRRYASWLRSAIGGDFGYSALYQMPVATVLWPRLVNTVKLSASAIALAWLVALPAGLWSGCRAGGVFDRAAAVGSSLLLATPDLVAGLAVVWIAAASGWLPAGVIAEHGVAAQATWLDRARPFVLPVLALAAVTAPLVYRHARAAVIEALGSRAVAAARLHGLSERTVLLAHVAPLAAVPLVPLLALSAASLLSASLAIEVVVAWPGLGALMLDAVLGRDLHLLVASTLMSAMLLLAATTGSDVLLRYVDPRVRSSR